jgi:hypothetical protein
VRLRSGDGSELVVLAAHLTAGPEFTVIDGELLPGVEPFGLLDSLPPSVLEAARVSRGPAVGEHADDSEGDRQVASPIVV